jgi:hypothetical protein
MNIRFFGEKDGSSERELKQKLAHLFERTSDIQNAYLAIVDYQDGQPPSVVLHLEWTVGEDHELVGQISKIFSVMFSIDEHLDMLFLNESQKAELDNVCLPFYIFGRNDS